jgi:hypothetical protein
MIDIVSYIIKCIKHRLSEFKLDSRYSKAVEKGKNYRTFTLEQWYKILKLVFKELLHSDEFFLVSYSDNL